MNRQPAYMNMKRIFLIISIAIITVLLTYPTNTYGNASPEIYINNQLLTMPSQEPPAFISNTGRTMVPVRLVSESLHAQVKWQEESQTVKIMQGDRQVILTPGKDETSAIIAEGRTFVPLRFVSESLGAEVTWNASEYRVDISTSVNINALHYSESVYVLPNLPKADVTINNPQAETQNIWLGYSLLSPSKQWIDLPAVPVTIPAHDYTTVPMEILQEQLPEENLLSGSYTAVFALWDVKPSEEEAQRLSEWQQEEAFRIYHHEEFFESFDSETWFSRDGRLGRSRLNPANVTFGTEGLKILLPKGTLQGGELQTLNKVHYGSYEVSMKLPDVPSSITGFFLYKAPDFYHEIDIELYNRKETEAMFTTYVDGAKAREAVYPLDFDPTTGYHRYRFDYYPDKVAFYIDDHLMQQLTDGFSQDPMYLMINAWHPSWLEGVPPHRDEFLTVEWIRY